MDKKINWKCAHQGESFLDHSKSMFRDFNGTRTVSENYHIEQLAIASALIRQHLNHVIAIIGDYDVDGMTSTAEAIIGLKSLNAANVRYYLPKRFTDGYGLSVNIVNNWLGECPEEGGLVITVDNGIAAIEAIDLAKDLGWDVLVIDHHLAKVDEQGRRILPFADVIVDPHVCGGADFTDYCGAGLVYKLWQSMGLAEDVMAKITSLAMIGTIGDSVKFIEESENKVMGYDNYLIVKNGLFTVLQNNGRTTGLYCLLRALNLDCMINEDNVGYTLAPTMNAASRLNDDGATMVLELIIRDDNKFNECDEIANQLVEFNTLRKDLTAEIMPKLRERIETAHMDNDYPIVVVGEPEEIHLGLVGIIAGKIAEEYQTMCVVLTPIEGGICKGSARAPEGANIKQLLDACATDLIAYGGHAAAAGLTMNIDMVDSFRKHANAVAGEKPASFFDKYYDFDIDTKSIKDIITTIKNGAPYGNGNEQPVFKFKNYYLDLRRGLHYQTMGKAGNVLKLFNAYADAIEFSGEGLEKFTKIEDAHPTTIPNLEIIGKLGFNVWQGKESPQISIIDILEV